MKYFTPQRYLQLGNLDNEQAFLAAQQEWEGAVSGYREHLQEIRKGLPRGLRQLVESVSLHDARVLSMSQEENAFLITLQPQSLPDRLIVLGYSLVDGPTIAQGVLPPDHCREPIEWLYDELDLDRLEGPHGSATIRHNILLSNGWEVALRFRSVSVKRPLRVVPVLPAQSRSA